MPLYRLTATTDKRQALTLACMALGSTNHFTGYMHVDKKTGSIYLTSRLTLTTFFILAIEAV